MYQYPHVSQLFILTSLAKPGIPGAIKIGWVCTADYRMLLGTAVRPVPARMPYISRLCDVGATDVKRWWWWWWHRSIMRTRHHHHHQLNVHFLPRLIKGMDGCFPTAWKLQLLQYKIWMTIVFVSLHFNNFAGEERIQMDLKSSMNSIVFVFCWYYLCLIFETWTTRPIDQPWAESLKYRSSL